MQTFLIVTTRVLSRRVTTWALWCGFAVLYWHSDLTDCIKPA